MLTPPNHAWYILRVFKFYKNDITLHAILLLLIPFNIITSRFIQVTCVARVHSPPQLCRIPPWDWATVYPFSYSRALRLFANLLFLQSCWEASRPRLCVQTFGNFSREGKARPNPWVLRLLFRFRTEVVTTELSVWVCVMLSLCMRGPQGQSCDITAKNGDHGSLSPVYVVPEPSHWSTFHTTTLLERDLNAVCHTFWESPVLSWFLSCQGSFSLSLLSLSESCSLCQGLMSKCEGTGRERRETPLASLHQDWGAEGC